MSLDLYNSTRKYFFSFLGRTTQKLEEIKHLEEYLPHYSPQMVSALEKGGSVNFLDIGAGTGKVSIPLLKRFQGMDYSAREPNLGMGILLYLNYLSNDFPMQRLSINPDPSTDYGKEKHDFVLASHSLYYLDDWPSALNAIYNSLVPGGAACIILGSKESGLFKLRDKFFPQLFGISPVPAESLERILANEHIPFTSHVLHSTLNISSSDLDSLDESRDKNILEDGLWDMSLDSLFSFLLRVDYSKLPESTKENVESLISHITKSSKHLELVDKAVWLYKKGNYSHKANPDFEPRKVNLGDLLDTFKTQFEYHFNKDVSALPPPLKEAYFSALALDCVLSHWIGKLLVYFIGDNAITKYDEVWDEPYPFPIPGRGIKEFLIYNPSDRKFSSFKHLGNDILLYGHNSDIRDYLFAHIIQEHEFLPEEEKAYLSESELLRLVLNIFRKFKHNQVFSSRCDGSTLSGCFISYDMFAYEAFKPTDTNAKLEALYRKLGLNSTFIPKDFTSEFNLIHKKIDATPSHLCSKEA